MQDQGASAQCDEKDSTMVWYCAASNPTITKLKKEVANEVNGDEHNYHSDFEEGQPRRRRGEDS